MTVAFTEGKIPYWNIVWIACPLCKRMFYAERLAFDSQYEATGFHCPFCGRDFKRKGSPMIIGL